MAAAFATVKVSSVDAGLTVPLPACDALTVISPAPVMVKVALFNVAGPLTRL